MNLNEFAKRVHAANIKWWQDIDTKKIITRNSLELLALAVSEVAECLEGERKNLMDDKLKHRKMAEVEMADTYIRLLDFSAGFGYNLIPYSMIVLTAENKGEALFNIMELIVSIPINPEKYIPEALAHIEGYCRTFGYDLFGAIEEKMKFNSTREDHTHEARKIAGGKQF